MAPKPPSRSKGSAKSPAARKGSAAATGRSSASSSKSKISRPSTAAAGKQQKTKRPATSSSSSGTAAAAKRKKKQRIYTDKELQLPVLNMITPAGVDKARRGKKKGKIFVDDRESMMTILAMVNAEKEGQIESKMIKARRLEEIREARKQEAEVRENSRKEKFEGVKRGLKRKRAKTTVTSTADVVEGGVEKKAVVNGEGGSRKATKKRVSFA